MVPFPLKRIPCRLGIVSILPYKTLEEPTMSDPPPLGMRECSTWGDRRAVSKIWPQPQAITKFKNSANVLTGGFALALVNFPTSVGTALKKGTQGTSVGTNQGKDVEVKSSKSEYWQKIQ